MRKETMANPNPSPATRFSAGNPSRGRQKGARDRFSAAFLTDFADDYEQHGKAAIQAVREKDPGTYMRVAASLLPKQVEISEDSELARYTDDEIEEMYQELRQRIEDKKRATVVQPGSIAPGSQRGTDARSRRS
jgi:hypothetical protein